MQHPKEPRERSLHISIMNGNVSKAKNFSNSTFQIRHSYGRGEEQQCGSGKAHDVSLDSVHGEHDIDHSDDLATRPSIWLWSSGPFASSNQTTDGLGNISLSAPTPKI